MFKKLWKTYVVDLFAIVLVFLLGVITKNYIGSVFTQVDLYQEQVQAIEGELVNQTLAGLIYMEQIVNDFSMMVWIAFVAVVFLLPILLYFIVCGSQIVNLNFLRKKFSFKVILKSLFLGMPLLIILLFVENSIVNSFAFFLDSPVSLFLLLVYALLGIFGVYIWAVLCVRLSKIGSMRKLNYRMWYKKFFRLFPLFFVLSLGHLALLGIVGFAVVRYVTESFVGLSWLYYVFGVLILLVGVQLLRVAFVKAVDKAAKSL